MYYQNKMLQPEFWICCRPAYGASFGIFSLHKFYQKVIKLFFTQNRLCYDAVRSIPFTFVDFFLSKNSTLVPLRVHSKNDFHQKVIYAIKSKLPGCKMLLEDKMA